MSTLKLLSAAPILPVTSIVRALAFYGKLGFEATVYGDGTDYAFLQRDGLQLHLRHDIDLDAAHNPAGVYFLVETGAAAGLEAAFRQAGVSLLSPLARRAWNMLEFVLSDPDGNLLRFGEVSRP